MSTVTLDIEKRKTLVPLLRFQEFEYDWKTDELGNISKITSGGTPSRSNNKFWNGNIPWISTTLINFNVIKTSEEYITDEAVLKSSAKLFPKGTILMAMYGQGKTRGKVAILGIDATTNQACGAILPKGTINTNYLYQNLAGRYDEIRDLSNEGGQQNLSGGIIKSIKISFPTLPEQQKIASFLSAVDEKIQQLTRKKELLEQYKKGVMQELFSGKLRFKDENGEDYPEWKKVNGNILFESISNKKHNSDLPILAITQDQGAIPRDLIDYKVSVTDKSVDSYKVVEIGDFVISLRSFQGGIEYSNYKGICSPAYIILRPTSDKVNNSFYKTYLKTSSYIKELQKNLEGIRDGKMISYKYFSDIKLPFPSFEEQQKIAKFLLSIDDKIESTNQQIIQTQTFKKGLLQQMFV